MGFMFIMGILMLLIEFMFFKSGGWLYVKLVLVILFLVYYFYCKKCMRELEKDFIRRNVRFYCVFNEIFMILMIFIVILVVVKFF